MEFPKGAHMKPPRDSYVPMEALLILPSRNKRKGDQK
jgi:hypothetical protein